MPATSGPHDASDPALDPNRIVMPPPERTRTGVQSGADAADDGSSGHGGNGVTVATGSGAGDGDRGGSSSADTGGAGSAQPPTAGESGGTGGTAAAAGGAGGVAVATGGSGDVGGRGTGGAGAGAAGKAASGGSGGRSQPQAGRGGGMRGRAGNGNGNDNAATFNELIDQLSNALTPQQRARIVQALSTNSVTPDQLNELLDAVTKAGSCESGHDSCQQMCRLVLNACPTCMLDRMTAEMEQARCNSL